MTARVHVAEVAPGCPVCNPGPSTVNADAQAVCNCIVDGYAEALRRWEKSCACCFGDAHPEGLAKAIEAARGN